MKKTKSVIVDGSDLYRQAIQKIHDMSGECVTLKRLTTLRPATEWTPVVGGCLWWRVGPSGVIDFIDYSDEPDNWDKRRGRLGVPANVVIVGNGDVANYYSPLPDVKLP